ncbi:CcdC family protein [Texcoconibacillus texcoconensis]|uniref:Membrane protein CcdC involved in cytochrome C biogenesis n=1 Tax=Texcoconibacillus texcoconensis TaxID=1095777 RepID=A0A840QT01_9BACI|nr:cytochrome c biogenesis protein CcdC [Texcoconibacillus texcoconensis]MBB5174443.1 membrane protein CcdC involved in cytochrome C biogenesis [Texcoconibacillus texcoconensis]
MEGLFFIGVAVFMMVTAMIVRMKAIKKPANVKKIILPPVFMTTGFMMFVHPDVSITTLQAVEAATVGLLFSIVLIKLSKFEIRDHDIYMVRSKAFFYTLIGLFALRLIFKLTIGQGIDYGEIAGMFFILAYAMIVSWRVAMFFMFKRLQRTLMKSSVKNIVDT